jgi:aminoglycoside phosphotransferase (APT) family kinase protein
MTAEKSTGQFASAGIVGPKQRDFTTLEAMLHDWLQAKLPDARDLKTSNFAYPLGAGMSHETILFDADWTEQGAPHRRGMVIRIKPTDHTVYQHDWFVEQYRIMETLDGAKVTPIATPLWLEMDPTILGAPFFVMEKRIGKVPVSFPPYSREGWVKDLSPQQRRKLWKNAVRALASIQSLPLTEVGFLDPENRYPDGFDQEWDRWRDYYDWARKGEVHPFLDDIWSRLERSRPVSRQPGLVWGDARIGNMMFDDDQNVIAVMDWEAPGIGGAMHDLGYWCVLSRIETEQQGVPLLEGMGTREETIALWSELTGIDTSEIEWYERFSALKGCCLAIRTMDLMPRERPGMNRYDNPATRVLAAMYGIEAPKPTRPDLMETSQA